MTDLPTTIPTGDSISSSEWSTIIDLLRLLAHLILWVTA